MDDEDQRGDGAPLGSEFQRLRVDVFQLVVGPSLSADDRAGWELVAAQRGSSGRNNSLQSAGDCRMSTHHFFDGPIQVRNCLQLLDRAGRREVRKGLSELVAESLLHLLVLG